MADETPDHRTAFASRSGKTRVITDKGDKFFSKGSDAVKAAESIRDVAAEAKSKDEAKRAKEAASKPKADGEGGTLPPAAN